MCFRPAEAELGPVTCPSCGKKINRIGGALPTKCPFCKTSTEGLEDADAAPAAGAPAAPAPAAPGAPKPPSAPTAPSAPPTGPRMS